MGLGKSDKAFTTLQGDLVLLQRPSMGIKPVILGPWVAQLVECPTLDFGSGHDLTVHEFEPHVGLCADSAGPG